MLPEKAPTESADFNEISENAAVETPPRRKKILKIAIFFAKLAICAVVLAWIATRLRNDWAEISRYDWRPRFGWLAASGAFYLAAYFPAATFWYLALRWLGQKPTYFAAVKSFYVSQLAKYVPGKAGVLVVRSAMVSGPKTKASVAAVCVFYETFTMMATGAFLAGLIVFIWFREHWIYSLLAFGTMLGAGLPLLPPIFIRILTFLRVGKGDPEIQASLKSLTCRSLLVGFGLMTPLWLLFGLFLWAAVLGIGVQPGPLAADLPRYVSATALAIVLGFAVPILPGGLGVREAVLAILLIPFFATTLQAPENAAFTTNAETLATIVSLVQRLVSVVAELVVAAAFFAVSAIAAIAGIAKTRKIRPQN